MAVPTKNAPGILWAVTAAYTIGVLGGNMQPLLIGALIDGLHLDAASAGLLGSIELVAVGLASFVLAPRMAVISRRQLVVIGALLACVGYGASAFQETFAALAVSRVLAGIGAGMVLAIGNAAVSACAQPDRMFAQMTIAGTVAITLVLALLPLPIARYTYRGGYAAMGVTTLLLLPALLWIPDSVAVDRGRSHFAATDFGLGLAVLVATALLFFSQSAIWAFSERIAVVARLTPHQIGVVLAGSTLIGLVGAFFASWMGTRAGRTLPLTSAVLATGITLLGIVYARTPATYTTILFLNGVAYLFMVPFVLGTAAALDRHGRWSAAAVGAATIGSALGPGIGGPVVEAGGYAAIGWLVFAAALVSATAITPVGRILDRRERIRRLDERAEPVSA